MKFWEKGTQVKCQGTSRFQEDQQRLNLQKNANGLYECRGRIQGDYPIYLPDDALFRKKLVMHAHLQTLHWGVSLTIAKIGEKYGIPRLRRLTKRVINECRGCKRFHVTALAIDWKPTQGKNRRISALQVHRSRLCWAYQVLQQEEKGDEGIYSIICMQFNPCRLFGSTTRSNNGIVFTQSETFCGETRTAGNNLLR